MTPTTTTFQPSSTDIATFIQDIRESTTLQHAHLTHP
jgi:hypothetical protein